MKPSDNSIPASNERPAENSAAVARMDERTLTALQGSIKKWKAIEAGRGPDNSSWNCPLCTLFIVGGCRGCPVFLKTGVPSCQFTPFTVWVNAQIADKRSHPFVADTPELVALARAEREFLESLLP